MMPTLKEFSQNLECCCICGVNHEISKCPLYSINLHIDDAEVPSKARLTVPTALKLEIMADNTMTIVANQNLNKGTQFGPVAAKKLMTLNPAIQFPMKMFGTDEHGDKTEYYLDTSDEYECNWMCLVLPASTLQEQNLVCYQNNNGIYFMTTRDIEMGTHLKVWYAPYYAKNMKAELLTEYVAPAVHYNENVSKSPVVNADSRLWCCKFCRQIEKSVSEYAEHLQIHYRKVLSRTCDICKDNFESRVALRKHEKLFHHKETDELELIARTDSLTCKANEKHHSDNRQNNTVSDGLVGGPLLNTDVSADPLENNILMQPTTLLESFNNINYSLYPNKSLNDTQNLLLDSENYSLNDVGVDVLLNETQEKELDDLTLELGESVLPQYVCDICLKGFTKIQYLLRHLKKHTEEYKCPHCTKIFCRKENLDSHSCLVKTVYTCPHCEKRFYQNKYLARHIAKHTKKFTCPVCQKSYAFATELRDHNCSCIPSDQKPKYSCQICNKSFVLEKYLRIHSKRHLNDHAGADVERSAHLQSVFSHGSCSNTNNKVKFICDICAETFATQKSLNFHKTCHETPKFVCEICSKRFNRQDVLINHMNTHNNVQYACEVCDKKLRSKQSLDTHKLQHSGNKPYSCKACGKQFFQRTNMMRHYATHLDESIKCSKCDKNFPSKFALRIHESRHDRESFKCKDCDQRFSKFNILKRHERMHRVSETLNTSERLNCPYCEVRVKYKTSLRRHVLNEHPDKKKQFNLTFYRAKVTSIVRGNGVTTIDAVEDTLRDEEEVADEEDAPQEEDPLAEVEDPLAEVEVALKMEPIPDPSVAQREVMLSMPELSEMELDQEIQLGNNAYILDDGTIVQPQDEGNVMLYFLDQNTNTYIQPGAE